jgi:hypothetical protein
MGSSHLVSSYCECGGGSGIVEPKFFPSNLHLLKKEIFRRHELATVLTVLLSSFIKKNLHSEWCKTVKQPPALGGHRSLC